MSKLFFLLFIMAVILESTFFPFPATFLLFLILYPFIEEKGEFWAFFVGLLLDIFIPRTLGVDSLIFLIPVFILRRYQQKLNLGQFIFNLMMVIILVNFYDWFFYKSWDGKRFMVIAGLATVSLYIFRRFFTMAKKMPRFTV